MIQLFMKRSGSPVIVPLNLPASHDAMTEAASQLDEASRAGKTEIVEIKSVIANLPSYLGGLDPDSRTQLAQLNRLASIIAKMDSRERNIYAGALDGNSINDLNDMIRVAEQVSDYILIPNVNSDVTLGRYVAVAGQIQGDPRFPEAAWPYLDFAKIGAEYYAEHGGAYTYAGYVLRKQDDELVREKKSKIQLGLSSKEIRQTYAHVPFEVEKWRSGQNLPTEQGLVLGCKGKKGELTALVDSDDIHCLMIGASGIGKTAYFLYPNLEYACASGMSWLALDSKGDLARNYGAIAKNCYGYQNVAVIDLRNPTRSDGNNLLTLVNRYMDIARSDPNNLAARAKAEKYAKILSKTIVNPDGDDSNRGQNAFFYDAAEGLLTSVILMLAEFLPPDKDHPQERRHIVSVFKLVQDLLEPSRVKGKSHFQLLMAKLPPDHKARWFAGAALNSADQAMASVMSTVLSRLNTFLDSELEQILCFDSAIDAEKFASEKSAIFLILPEEDTTKNFMAGLMIQNLSRELFAVADENGGKLKNRVVLFCDEFGTMPPFDILPLFSAGRSRRLTLVPIIQSLAQLEKNYGKEGCEIIQDNCQDTIFGGFAPNSQTAEVLSKALGSRTVLSGSVSRGKNDPSQSLQMMERALLTPDELKSIPKGSFIVMKTGTHPMRTRLQLFLNWGITFGEPFVVPERANRAVAYVNRVDLERNLPQLSEPEEMDESRGYAVSSRGGIAHAPAQERTVKRGKQMKTFGE